MSSYILLIPTDRALVPVIGLILAPGGLIVMGGGAGQTTDIAICVTGMIVCMGGQLIDLLCSGCEATGTGVSLDAFFFTSSLLCNGTAVPAMAYRLFL